MLYRTQDKVNKQLKQDDLAPVKYYFQVIIRPIDDIRHRFNSFYSSVRIIMQETNQEQLSQDWQNNHLLQKNFKEHFEGHPTIPNRQTGDIFSHERY